MIDTPIQPTETTTSAAQPRPRLQKYITRLLLAFLLACLLLVGLPNLIVNSSASAHLFDAQAVPAAPVAIVFGAGLQRDGRPSAILRDRVEMAADLYFDGKVQKLLMSGDNRFENYNEPGSMQQYAIDLGVPAEDIVLDYAGRRTYDTCYRAKHIFGVDQAILVTQRFHLSRALYLCNTMGVDADGVPADKRQYLRRSLLLWNFRESMAIPVAVWEVLVAHPLPVLGEPEPIF